MNDHFWNDLISNLPDPHILQTQEWGQVKQAYDWQPFYLAWAGEKNRMVFSSYLPELELKLNEVTAGRDRQSVSAAAMVLKKQVTRRGFAARLCILYCPKGPLMDWGNALLVQTVLTDLQNFARAQGAVFLKLDPDVVTGTGLPGAENETEGEHGLRVLEALSTRGWVFSADQIQFRNTVMLDVRQADDILLSRMKQKTRYNVRLGPKKGLQIREGGESDWPMLYQMYVETSVRDGFVIRDQAYYRSVWNLFKGRSAPLIAEMDGLAVAAVYLFQFAGRAYYIYGMSRDMHRELMPNYMLQFEAMRWAREHGCSIYDLWGAPDEFVETDSMWGVFRFKEGLGGTVRRTIGAWDYAPNRLWYWLYTRVVPRLLDIMRWRGRSRTRQQAADGLKD
ncbi:MAG: peptidoglycan bridge formation glycyltransferase FemA/FemB family protein [Chloroflexota bacterium]